MHRFVLLFALLGAPFMQASAQIMRRATEEPAAWTSLGAAIFSVSQIQDKETRATWSFGQGIQYRATLEKALSGGAGIGLTGTYSKIPLTYTPEITLFPGSGSCSSRCEATANIYSVGAGFHMGGGAVGIHQVIQANIGATYFGNFREDESGDKLPPAKADADLSFQVGYGVGYAFSPRVQMSLLQEFGLIIHPGNGEGSSSRMGQTQVTRLSIRYGMGTKKPPQPGIRRW